MSWPQGRRFQEQTPVDLSEGDHGITVGRAAVGPATGRSRPMAVVVGGNQLWLVGSYVYFSGLGVVKNHQFSIRHLVG